MSDNYECPICAAEFHSELSWQSHYDKKHDESLWFDIFEKILNKNILNSASNQDVKTVYQQISLQVKTHIRTKKEFKREERVKKKKKTQKQLRRLRDKKLKKK